ncbi:MAG: GHKL domain-containing protein [Candidatus Marinimicrobia bacterium]|nr:GHKL domain-containing protein [Candidatus Neomarinimicrobiota bacterium]
MNIDVVQVSSFGLIEGGALLISLLGTILYTMLGYVMLRRPLKQRQEKIVLLTALGLLLYFAGNFMALFPRTLVFDTGFNVNRLGWIITLAGISVTPALLIHAYGTYYCVTRDPEKTIVSRSAFEVAFTFLHSIGFLFLIGFFVFTNQENTLRTLKLSSTRMLIFFESYAIWLAVAFFIVALISLKMSAMKHWVRFRFYFYQNGILMILISLITMISFWGLHIVSAAPQVIRLVFLLLALIHGMMLSYYRLQYEFINIFVRPSLVYFTLAGLIVLVYQFGIKNLTEFLSQYPVVNVEVIELLLLLILIFLFQPARVHIQARINALFFQESRKFQDSMHTISKQLKTSTNLDHLFPRISDQLVDALGVNQVSIIMPNTPEAAAFVATNQFLRSSSEPLLTYNMTSSEVAEEFAAASYELIVAIREEKEVVLGLLAVTSKQLYKTFSNQDIHLVTTVANQLAIYIKNANLIEEQVNMERMMLNQDNLSSLGQISANITHDIKNPLSAINTLVQVMQEEMPKGDALKSSLVTIENELEYLNLILSEIVKYSEPESGHQQIVSVDEVLHGVQVLLHTEARLHGVTLVLHTKPGFYVLGTPQGVKKIFFNLIFNAIQACQKKGGVVDIETSEEAGDVVVKINDSGPGLPESESDDIFEPYVTTKPDGVGLGLTIVKETLRNMHGSIEATNRTEGGAQFTVRMPKAVKG